MLWHASFHWPHLAQAGPSMAATALILHAATRAPIAPMGQQPPWEEVTSSTRPQADSSGLFNTWVGLSGLPRSGAPQGPAGQPGASHSSSSIVCHRVGTLALSTAAWPELRHAAVACSALGWNSPSPPLHPPPPQCCGVGSLVAQIHLHAHGTSRTTCTHGCRPQVASRDLGHLIRALGRSEDKGVTGQVSSTGDTHSNRTGTATSAGRGKPPHPLFSPLWAKISYTHPAYRHPASSRSLRWAGCQAVEKHTAPSSTCA